MNRKLGLGSPIGWKMDVASFLDDPFGRRFQAFLAGFFFFRNNTSLDFGAYFGDFTLIPGHDKDVERHLEKGTTSFSP